MKRNICFFLKQMAVAMLFALLTSCSARQTQNTLATGSNAPMRWNTRDLVSNLTAERGRGGEIYISGRSNLLDGTRLGIELPLDDGHLAADYRAIVQDGVFQTTGLMDGTGLLPAGGQRIHLLSYLSDTWQPPYLMNAVNATGGRPALNSPFLDLYEVIQIPPPGPAVTVDHDRAIRLVKDAFLNVDGRLARTNVEDHVEQLLHSPEVRTATGWSARCVGEGQWQVTFAFVNGVLGDASALWKADLNTGQVRYLNHFAEGFSR